MDYTKALEKYDDWRVVFNEIKAEYVANPDAYLRDMVDEDARDHLVYTIINKCKEIKRNQESNIYKELRAKEYPAWTEIMEALIENMEGRPEKLTLVKKKRKIVRDKYPKDLSCKLLNQIQED